MTSKNFEEFWNENKSILTCSKSEAKISYEAGYGERDMDMVKLRFLISKICQVMDVDSPRIVLDVGIKQLKDAVENPYS